MSTRIFLVAAFLAAAIQTPAHAQRSVPTSLQALAPHEIVEAFLAERAGFELTPQQVRELEKLHVAVRDERHRYTRRAHGSKGPEHMMMEPMITKRRAYDDALSHLTPDQQGRAARWFRNPDYRLPQKVAAN
jgi:hypothetical protein